MHVEENSRMKRKHYIERIKMNKVSLSVIMTVLVVLTVLLTSGIAMSAFLGYYKAAVEQSAVTGSEQSVVQVQNTVTDYTQDMRDIMEMIRENIKGEEAEGDEFFSNLLTIRKDVVADTTHSPEGELLDCWSNNDKKLKKHIYKNLSYIKIPEDLGLYISSPHVETLFENDYPWVVTIVEHMEDKNGDRIQVSMDIRFSNIASYVDDVGIGQHGYCFIMDTEGNLVYHPQQQLIYAGLKEEDTELFKTFEDGTHTQDSVIYTIYTLENCNWRIVGVSYVDELITSKVTSMLRLLGALLFIVLAASVVTGMIFSNLISKPAKELAAAMSEFEKDAETFEFCPVNGTSEIVALSDSFGHMVVRIQELMDRVRKEEITLRKTELNALQAQINPHFLYNTLDSIAWMCEEERNQEAVVMVNALAKLFRISISKGHELITIQKECEHAESYLKIQKYRYKNQFSYEFHVDERCRDYLCNKITLQPIIENAIYHGLDMSDEGKIVIEVSERADDILMSVTDNGVGMSPQQCEEILHRDAKDKTGIGIKNVNDRIKIYFGEKYGLTISSEQDVGTRVDICIPKILEEVYGAR